jgi:hypothetical protein
MAECEKPLGAHRLAQSESVYAGASRNQQSAFFYFIFSFSLIHKVFNRTESGLNEPLLHVNAGYST